MKSSIILIAILAISTSLHINHMLKSMPIDINESFDNYDVSVTFTRIYDCKKTDADKNYFACKLDYEIEGAEEQEKPTISYMVSMRF
jgi:hypothetical protein